MNKDWTRKELKAQGKALFKLNYWKCVLVALILGMLGGVGGASYSSNANNQVTEETINSGLGEAISNIPPVAWIAVAVTFVFVLAIGIAISVFLINPLKVGCYRFFTVNHYAPANLNEVGYGFTSNYKNVAKTMFFMDLYVFLWSLLFVIPGIVKSYSYRMVPYILAENPDLTTDEALALSKQMMDGQKWRAFVLDLSFIGWILLSILTLGILVIFYVNPYIEATNAELYHALKPAQDVYTGEEDFATAY